MNRLSGADTVLKSTVPVLLVLVAFIIGCKPDPIIDPSAPVIAPVSLTSKPGDTPDSPVVATIGDREITFEEVNSNLDALPVFVRMRYQASERRLEFLEAYIEYQVLALAAVSEGYASDPLVVDALKKDMVQRYVRDNVDLKLRTADISDDVIFEYYSANPWEFHRPAQNQVSRILVKDAITASKVAFRARSLVDAASGDPIQVFAGLVKANSQDPDAAVTGGDIGFYPHAGNSVPAVPPKVAAAAASMELIHSVAGPIQDEDGFSVLFLAAKRPAVEKTLDEARTEIAATILDDRRRASRKALVDSLISKHKVTVNTEVLVELAAQAAAARKDQVPGLETSR
jgi:parvulin-like peptidyl-prolyl isomerase